MAIKDANLVTAQFRLVGTSPLVMNKFSEKAKQQMLDKHKQGSTATKGTGVLRVAKDPEKIILEAIHRAEAGWVGVPASAFRRAIISACRLVGFKMTIAKLSVFIEADGYDVDQVTPLVKLEAGDYISTEMTVRNDTGVPDVRCRPMWREWALNLRVRFDADQFTLSDVEILLNRVGQQVGILEGRPDSKDSAGMGWGMFKVEGKPVKL